MKEKVFNPEKSFFELSIVRWSFFIIISLSLLATAAIIINNTLIFDFTYTGFNQFISIFKVPIGILAAAIPIVAVYATNHRSEQTKKQIEIANSQNNFINHFKHIEEFEKYIDSHFHEPVTQLTSARKTYNKLFPNSREGNFTLSEGILNKIEEDSQEIVTCLIEVNESNINSISDPEVIFTEVERKAEMLLNDLGVFYKSNWGAKYESGENSEGYGYTSSKLWFVELQRHFDAILQILNFNRNQKLPTNFNALVSIKVEGIPDIKN